MLSLKRVFTKYPSSTMLFVLCVLALVVLAVLVMKQNNKMKVSLRSDNGPGACWVRSLPTDDPHDVHIHCTDGLSSISCAKSSGYPFFYEGKRCSDGNPPK